jgi:large subunit ribosomal protein L18
MKHGPRFRVKPRRLREGRTNYRKRLKLLKSKKIRIVVRKTLKNTIVQFIKYNPEGDEILASAVSNELKSKKYNWKFSTSTTPAAYLTGLLAGKRAVEKGIKEGILDIGLHRPTTGSKVFAVVKGIEDAGVTCPYDPSKLPSEDRLLGKHLDEEIPKEVEKIKNKILGEEV